MRRRRSKSPGAKKASRRAADRDPRKSLGKHVSVDEFFTVLYNIPGKTRDLPDNYVDLDAMMSRVSHETKGSLSFSECIFETEVVLEQVSLVFGLCWLHQLHALGTLEALQRVLLLYGISLTAFMALCSFLSIRPEQSPPQLLLSSFLLFTFSPMLKTLTQTYSTDTVYILAFCCGCAHLILYDYKKGSLATNAAAFLMCLLLSSRFERSEQVAAYLVSSVFLLVLTPIGFGRIRKMFGRYSSAVAFLINICIAPVLHAALRDYTNRELAVSYACLVTFISCICPVILRALGPFKNVVLGPWEVASVEI